jgi:outer membrane protein assembly factor BamC
MKPIPSLPLLALALLLSGCSVLQGDKIDYKSAGKAPSLDVPPDLTQLARDTRYALPGAPVTASSQQATRVGAGVPTASLAVGDVRIERVGNQRWLVVNRPADQVWGPLREFWQENGFLLTTDQAELGIMETDWAENRAKIPQDMIRSALGRLFDSLYSTAERDRFRTRLERTASGGTEVYVTHRGMIEVYTRGDNVNRSESSTAWQPRPADPELETEFLRRMMIKLGVSQEQAKAVAAAGAPAKPVARASKVGNTPVVEIDEGFDRAWRRVGLSLDRTGFTVEDRDRAQGIYFVRYVEPTSDKKEKGFFSRLFSGSEKPAAPLKFRITLRSEGASTTVSVLNAAGEVESSATAQRIVQVLADDLK